MKLLKIKEYSGEIIIKTGLHIGSGDAEMHIGGTDNPVIKHPFTMEPYIPGSSLKGKVRSLLELKSGFAALSDGKPFTIKTIRNNESVGNDSLALNIVKMFGSSGAEEKELKTLGPTRISFADCMLTETCREQARKGEVTLTEIKSENSINRITGKADNPRYTERVPAGITFDFKITLKIFENDNEQAFEKVLFEGLKLLESDALGGNGSRGYGRVQFRFNDETLNKTFQETKLS